MLRNMEGLIRSPNYPFKYPHSARCTWTIEGPEETIIRLNVLKFELEIPNHLNKCVDWVVVSFHLCLYLVIL